MDASESHSGRDDTGARFGQILIHSAGMPGVCINRAGYLRSALQHHCTDDQIEAAIATTPAEAGISREIIDKVADTAVRFETGKVSALSAAAGLPGGIGLVAAVPVDVAQYYGHVLRVAQKLAYLYSWPDIFDEKEGLDEATESLLILFVGVMFGVNGAQAGVSKVAAQIASQVVKKLPQRALTKGVIYPIVKKVAAQLGVQMTKRSFAGGVAKAVPVVGAVFSGGLTLATFLPMSRRLQKHLAGLDLARPRRGGLPPST